MFNAPIYYEDVVSSTMDFSRKLAAEGAAHGTVVAAEYQENGRGRGSGRSWHMERGKSLSFTVLLRYPRIENIPTALTLRTGLAVALAIEEFEASLKGKIKIKWPNDILIRKKNFNHEPHEPHEKKVAGILCEADGGIVHVGIGVNAAQKEFPAELREKATSIALAAGKDIESEKRFVLMKMILKNMYEEFSSADYADYADNWKTRLEQRLYKKDEQVAFIEGSVDSGKKIHGILNGIDENGLIIIDNKSYTTGELKL